MKVVVHLSEVTVLLDDENLFASHDENGGMVVTYTDECPLARLAEAMVMARDRGYDIKEQWWDTEDERHVLTFGNAEPANG